MLNEGGTVKPDAARRAFLPVIRIDTAGGAPVADRENYVNMTFTLTDPDNPNNDVTAVSNKYGIRGRGHSTWEITIGGGSKKPYRIKFDRKQSLFGLPAAKSWVLLAEYVDPTLIKNMTAFEFGNVLNMPYNHTYRHIRLYLNGEYRGVYGLTEHNQAGRGRVDIDRDYGWFINVDRYYDKGPRFRTESYGLPVMIRSPKAEPADIDNPAYGFVIKDVNGLCDFAASPDFPENGYRDLIDMGIFVDYLLVQEFLLHGELSAPGNVFMYRDKGGKICIGPLWDFDWAFGVGSVFGYYDKHLPMHNFFLRFFQDPVFLAKYKERWNGKYSEIRAVSEFIGRVGGELEGEAYENFKIWMAYLPQTDGHVYSYAEVIAKMLEWWDNRCTWLNGEMNKVEVLPSSKVMASGVLGYGAGDYSWAFTLVSYGGMSDLSASLEKGGLSDFEIIGELGVASASGGGGYLASVRVSPRGSLPAGTYADTLILSGVNRGEEFSFAVPLIFAVDEESAVTVMNFGRASVPGLRLAVEPAANSDQISRGGILPPAVVFYREGGRIANAMCDAAGNIKRDDCELGIYGAEAGNIIRNVKITDDAEDTQERRKVGEWDLTDKNGRRVPAGTYLVNGVVKTGTPELKNGRETLVQRHEEVSVIVGVR